MKWKSTVGLVVAFGALLVFYLLYDKNAKMGEEAAREAKKVFKIEEKNVRTIRIVRPEGSVALERTGAERWMMSQPVRVRADRWAASSAAGALADLEQLRAFKNDRGDKGLEEMGLAKPRARVEFTLGTTAPAPPSSSPPRGETATSGRSSSPPPPAAADTNMATAKSGSSSTSAPTSASEPTSTGGGSAPSASAEARVVEFGADVPASSSIFARIPGRDEVLLVPSSAAAPFLKSVDEFRDRALLDATVLDIGEAAVAREGGELRFKRRDEEWWLDKPVEDLAAGETVQSLLSTLLGLRAEKFLDSAPSPEVDPARTTIRLFDLKGAELATLRLGAPVPGENARVYARADTPSGAGPLVTVTSGGLDALSKPASDFRLRKALAFHTWEIAGLNLTSPKVTLSLEKKNGEWTAASPASLKVDATAVERTLELLADLEVGSFDPPPGASPASLDLDPPRTKVEVRAEAPGNKVKTLVLGGRAAGGQTIYARSIGRPGVFTVDGSILERIEGGPSLYALKEPAHAPAAPAAGAASQPSGAGHATTGR